MSRIDIVRAWKDPEYRNSLSAAQLAGMPENPAGEITLDDKQLSAVNGGALPIITTAPTCTMYTFLGWYACCR
jgi:mersacidin/lichenicidin family type 2 lantibiotic